LFVGEWKPGVESTHKTSNGILIKGRTQKGLNYLENCSLDTHILFSDITR